MRSWVKVALLCAVFGSAGIGFGYALLFALPEFSTAIGNQVDTLAPGAILVAAVGFAIAQVVAGALALRERPAFFVWLLPAAIYLLVIGLVGWLRDGEIQPLWLDSARGLALILLGYAQFRRIS